MCMNDMILLFTLSYSTDTCNVQLYNSTVLYKPQRLQNIHTVHIDKYILVQYYCTLYHIEYTNSTCIFIYLNNVSQIQLVIEYSIHVAVQYRYIQQKKSVTVLQRFIFDHYHQLRQFSNLNDIFNSSYIVKLINLHMNY